MKELKGEIHFSKESTQEILRENVRKVIKLLEESTETKYQPKFELDETLTLVEVKDERESVH